MVNLKLFLKELRYFFLKVHAYSLNKHAPFKKKHLSYDNNPFLTKDFRKQMMVRSKLRNTCNKNRNYKSWKLTLLHRWFSRFLNCTNGTKSHNAPRIWFDSCVHFKTMCGCLFALLNNFNQLFFKGKHVPWRA